MSALLDDTNTYVTGSTLSGTDLILYRNDGGTITTDLSYFDQTPLSGLVSTNITNIATISGDVISNTL